MVKNIFYFKYILAIGGTEQFLYEIAKKYGLDHDIVVMYERGDARQIARLSRYVKCIQWNGKDIVECEKYFANFNLDQANYVKAKEYYFVVHANFNELGYKPNISTIEHLNPKYIAVSKWAKDEFEKFTGKPCDYCYNPLTLEPKEKVMHLVSACRLDDEVKGGKRTLKLIEALDRYCSMHNRHYDWKIFTNTTRIDNISPNVCFMKPRVDVRAYIQDADYVLQLSNDMETYCYTTNEAWSYGVHTITTPFSVNKELPIPKEANYILEYDCSNVDDVARHIFEDELKTFVYKAPQDNWGNLLVKGESQYQKELKMKMLVKATKNFEKVIDNEVGRVRQEGEMWEVSKFRYDQLKAYGGLIEDVIQDAQEPTKEVKKAVRKTTPKK